MLVVPIKAPLEPIFILRAIGGNPQDLGFAEAAWGLGMLLGAVEASVAARHWHRVRLLPVGLVAIGVCVLVASTATTLFLAESCCSGSWPVAEMGSSRSPQSPFSKRRLPTTCEGGW